MGADTFGRVASNNNQIANESIYLMIPTGVEGVGEFVEIGVEPRRSTYFFMDKVFNASAKTQAIENEYGEVGVSHSSDEMSNDHGAKG